MLNILVIDDEALHLRGFVKMLQQINEDFAVDSATNGKNALRMVKDTTYGIIFVDVKMPVMDGFQFLKKAKPFIEHSKVIILSGYADFQFAKKAIEAGAFDYALKPISRAKVTSIVEKAEDELFEEKFRSEKIDLLQSQVDLFLPIYVSSFFTRILMGNLIPEEHASEISTLMPKLRCGGIVIFNLKPASEDTLLSDAFTSSFKDQIYLKLRNYGQFITFKPLNIQECPNIYTSVYFGDKDMKLYDPSEAPEILHILNNIEQILNTKISVSVGKAVNDLATEAPLSFNTASEAMENMFYEPSTLNIYKDAKIKLTSKISYQKSIVNKVSKALLEGNLTQAKENLINLFDGILQVGKIKPKVLKNEMLLICKEIAQTQIHRIPEAELGDLCLQVGQNIDASETLFSLKEVTNNFLESINVLTYNSKTEQEIRIKRILDYIDKNVDKNIPIEELSNMVGLNKAYFSSFFKSATGLRFSDYILRYRMENAKALILESDKKIYEISLIVGYNAPEYFNNVFKKYVGFTPEQFRRIYRRRSK